MSVVSQAHSNAEARAGALRIKVGLGNPGPKYARTRHNAGSQSVEHLARSNGLRFRKMRFKSSIVEGRIAGIRVVLARPLTFMNLCGQAVGPLVHWHHLNLDDLLVVYDDLDLPLGLIRLRANGGSGGHKGMESIITTLGTRDFPRLRVGIGRSQREDPADYVLRRFTYDEMIVMESSYARASQAIECYLTRGIAIAMNEFNG